MFTARYALIPYISQIPFVFKGLKSNGNYCYLPTFKGIPFFDTVPLFRVRLSHRTKIISLNTLHSDIRIREEVRLLYSGN